MKKTVVIILILLPILLIISISFAGRILSQIVHISVDNIMFVDEDGNEIEDNMVTINKGETYQINVKVMPELATYKDVTYFSRSANICTVTKNGLVEGLEYGASRILVTSKDTQVSAVLTVKVHTSEVTGVTLPTTYNMGVGDNATLTAMVLPWTASNKSLIWTTNNADVATVNSVTGLITARSQGVVTITCTTQDGGFKASCLITVSAQPAFVISDLNEGNVFTLQSEHLATEAEYKLNLHSILTVDTTRFTKSDVIFTVTANSTNGQINMVESEPILTVNNTTRVQYITIKAQIMSTRLNGENEQEQFVLVEKTFTVYKPAN